MGLPEDSIFQLFQFLLLSFKAVASFVLYFSLALQVVRKGAIKLSKFSLVVNSALVHIPSFHKECHLVKQLEFSNDLVLYELFEEGLTEKSMF